MQDLSRLWKRWISIGTSLPIVVTGKEWKGLGYKSSGSDLSRGAEDVQQGTPRGPRKQEQLNRQATGKYDTSAEQPLEAPSPRVRKCRQLNCVPLEPRHTLTKALHDLINGQMPVFISQPSDMTQLYRL
ncbi:hypothetical protein BGZ90_011253 [Linnemannia elongata]|nr:hypothetical protein BGZ90_011253 [Linnemannia elongata]